MSTLPYLPVISTEADPTPSLPTTVETSLEARDHGSADLVQHTATLVTSLPSPLSAESAEGKLPFLEIVEQPRQRGFRFRYSCEGPSHGGLPGERSEKHRKSYPTVVLHNHTGRAKVVVSVVSADEPAKPHAHRLIGRAVHNGICTADIGPECEHKTSFNLGILHATKKNIGSNLLLRLGLTAKGLDYDVIPRTNDVMTWRALPQSEELSDEQILGDMSEEHLDALSALAKEMAAGMNLSLVCLCFQAFLEGSDGQFNQAVAPVISHPVFDSKAPSSASLKICRMDRCSGSVDGNEEIFLLCDRVQKDDIEVVFFDGPLDGSDIKWTTQGMFSSSDVHRQFCIVVRTPPYHDLCIQAPVSVCLALRRKSDGELSEAKPFIYYPLRLDPERLACKRLKSVPNFSTEDYTKNGSQPPAKKLLTLPTSGEAPLPDTLQEAMSDAAAASASLGQGVPFPLFLSAAQQVIPAANGSDAGIELPSTASVAAAAQKIL